MGCPQVKCPKFKTQMKLEELVKHLQVECKKVSIECPKCKMTTFNRHNHALRCPENKS